MISRAYGGQSRECGYSEGVLKVWPMYWCPAELNTLSTQHREKKVGKEDNYMDLDSKKSNQQNGLYSREREILWRIEVKLYHAITNGTSSVDHQTLNTIFNSSLPRSI